jgi:hypothetical protein
MRVKRAQNLVILLFALLILSGCAGLPYKPFPPATGKTAINVLGDGPNKMNDMPGRQYQIPGSQVYILRIKSPESAKADAAFGVLVVVAAMSAERENAKQMINEAAAEALRINLTEETRKAIDEALGQGKFPPGWSFGAPQETSNRLALTPYIILTVEDTSEIAQPYFLLKVKFTGKGTENWVTRYIYYSPERHRLTEWIENRGEPFISSTRESLQKIFEVMLRDIRREGEQKTVPTKLRWKWITASKPYDQDVELIRETKDDIIFNIPTWGMIDSGINIVPRNDVEKLSP